jgi:hypothetical protein
MLAEVIFLALSQILHEVLLAKPRAWWVLTMHLHFTSLLIVSHFFSILIVCRLFFHWGCTTGMWIYVSHSLEEEKK